MNEVMPASRYALAFLVSAQWAHSALCVTRGQVVDPSGAPVPGVTVSLFTAEQAALVTSRTGMDGSFTFGSVPCGSYLLSASHMAFRESRVPVRLEASRPVPISVSLSLVPVEEQVTVTAEAGSVGSRDFMDQRTTVIARSALMERTKSVLTEAAQGEPGVHEQRTSPAMGAFFVRGLSGKNVSVYRDGFRYTTSAQRGGVSTFQNLVDPAFLDSVEFVRGTNSAQFGSDSLGGAVNLLSTFPLDQTRTITGEAAPFADWAAASFESYALLGINQDRLGSVIVLSGRRLNTSRAAGGQDSHSAVTRFLGLPADILGDRLPDTAFTQYGGSLHSQFRVSDSRLLVFHYERSQQDGAKRYDQLLGGDGNLIADLRNLMLDFGYLRYQSYPSGMLDQFTAGVSYNAQREERVNQGGQGDALASISHQYERLAAWGLNLAAGKNLAGHAITLGGEGYVEKAAAPAFTFHPLTGSTIHTRGRIRDGARYLTHGIFLQDIWRPTPRIRISGSLRFGGASYSSQRTPPADSLAANALTGRIGAALRIAGPVFIHGRYSRGFRAPNMTDLGSLGLQGNGAFEISPNDAGAGATIGSNAGADAKATGRSLERLRPETSDNFDAGVTIQHRRLRAEFTAFRIDLGNTIVSQTLLLPPGAPGQPLGDQIITRQLQSGAVFVPLSTRPVLVRANYFGARLQGVEQSFRVNISSRLTFNENFTWIAARDERTGLPPDIEPGIPPATLNPSLLFTRNRFWIEAYGVLAGRQERLSALALADRRIGAVRSRNDIAAFFENGAAARGLVANGRLIPTGETLREVQDRVLGSETSAPLLTAVPGYALAGLRFGVPVGDSSDFLVDLSNLTDKSYRGMGWGMPGTGRSIGVRYRIRF